MTHKARWTMPYVLVSLWLATTLALAGWWLVFGLSQARQLQALGHETATQLGHVQRMLAWEGTVLLLLLVGGGVALIVAIRREQARRRQLQDFFSLFTHDLKTALASLQLQAESLQEDLGPTVGGASLQRLMRDAVRLRLQLENSLYYAQPEAGLVIEPLNVREAITQLAADWPEMEVSFDGDATVLADRRAFEGITRNVLQNAAVHGQASTITVGITPQHPSVRIDVKDNGSGASLTALRAIAESERRPAATSGTGLGLLISRRLIERMQGTLVVAAAPQGGVIVTLTLPEAA